MLDTFAGHEGEAVDLDAAATVSGSDHEVLEARHRRAGGRAEGGRIGRNLAPGDHMQPLGLHDPADLGAGPVGQSRIVGKEGHTDGVLPRRRQLVADDTAQQTIGDLDQDSRSVTGVGLSSSGPAVLEVRQRPQAGQHEIMARAALDVGHEGHAA